MSVFSPKRRKTDEVEEDGVPVEFDGVLSEPIGHYWQNIFETGERADVLVCVKDENGDDVLLKVIF